MHTTLNYSPNFDIKRRDKKNIKFIIFHYTGMKKELDAIKKLTDENSKVSSHYFVKYNGEILTLVPDTYTAWHAGVSSWKKFVSLNKFSIGIEISNPGHEFKYKKYSKYQIDSLIKLSKYLIKKYKIKPSFILGHSDISCDRKKDPGEKFPWKLLSENKIGLWHDLNQKDILKKRNIKLNESEKENFLKNLKNIGYSSTKKNSKTNYKKMIVMAFQRRFRPELVNGSVDKECQLISKNLINKFK